MSNRERPARPGKTPKPPRLTRQQDAFVDALVNDPKGNQTAAALKAGYSPKTACSIASEMMRDPKFAHVQAAYDERLKQRKAHLKITPERTLEEVAAIAYGDRRRVGKWGNDGYEPNESDDLFPEEAAMVAGFSQEDTKYGTRTKVKFESKLEALKLLGKKDKLWIDKVEMELDLSGAHGELTKLFTKLANNLEAGEQLRRELGL